MSLFLTLFLFIMALLYMFFTRSFKYWTNKNVKGPKPIPIFGNLIEMALRKKHVGMIYEEIYNQFPNEKVVGIYRMTNPCLLIRDLDIVKQILVKDFDYFSDRGIEFSKDKLGNNLFHCDTDTWRVLRHRLSPIFTSGKLRSMFPLLNDCSDRFIEYLSSVCMNQQDQDTYHLIMRYTIATIMNVFFGLNVDTFKADNKLFEEIDIKTFRPSYGTEMDMLFPGFLRKYNLSIFPKIVNDFCHEIAQIVSIQRGGIPSERCDLLDIMMDLKQRGSVKSIKRRENEKDSFLEVTDNVIASQIFVFIAAGYVNNTLAASYALYYLAQNIDAQEKLIAEIDEVLQKYKGDLNYDCLKDMKYLEMVFHETLRLHPLTNSVSRHVNRDYKIADANLTLRKGTSVVISLHAIQHDEKYYPNPDKFDPERFSAENSADRHPCAFIVFGAGPRACLGIRFARIQFGVCMVKVLSKFRVECSGEININQSDPWKTFVTPLETMYLKFIPRNK